MAQTTTWVTMRNNKLEMSVNGSAWTDIGGHSNSISLDGGERKTGETYTFDGDLAIVSPGKREPTQAKVRAVYTEGASDAAEIVRTAYENASDFYLRWSPKGGTSGQFQYTTAKGIVTNPPYPQGEAESPDPILIEFTLKIASITKAVVA